MGDEARTLRVLRECAEIPLDETDGELAALAIAIHLEDALGLLVPEHTMDHHHLVPPAARERTVRHLLGES